MLTTIITEKDEEVLKHLINIEVYQEEANDDLGCILHFAPNEHLTNETLKCHIKMKEEDAPSEIVGTAITWNEGKDTTKKLVTKKIKK